MIPDSGGGGSSSRSMSVSLTKKMYLLEHNDNQSADSRRFGENAAFIFTVEEQAKELT
jgi:hypothetical protein